VKRGTSLNNQITTPRRTKLFNYSRTSPKIEAAPNVCGRISSAHTLQRSRVLRAIESSDHHILTFYPMRFEGNKLNGI
jgi:hypothetical protein